MRDDEVMLSAALRRYVDRPGLELPADEVVRDAQSRGLHRGRLLPVGLLSLALVGVLVGTVVAVALQAAPPAGSDRALASVGGVEYLVGIGRGLAIDEQDLQRFGTIDAEGTTLNMADFRDGIAFALANVSPDEALVARTAPGLSDDSGDYPAYFILWGPEAQAINLATFSAELCAYFDRLDPVNEGLQCRAPAESIQEIGKGASNS